MTTRFVSTHFSDSGMVLTATLDDGRVVRVVDAPATQRIPDYHIDIDPFWEMELTLRFEERRAR